MSAYAEDALTIFSFVANWTGQLLKLLLSIVIAILAGIWHIVLWLLLWLIYPATVVWDFTKPIALWPYQFLARFETLYIYFGTACLAGLLAGAILHCGYIFLSPLIRWHAPSEPQVTPKRTVASYRADRRKRKLAVDDFSFPASPTGPTTPATNSSRFSLSGLHQSDQRKDEMDGSLLSQTIVEEEDSDI